jgi:hypothetical protein
LLLPPAIALAKAGQILKGCSSKWLNDPAASKDFAWFGAPPALHRQSTAFQ